MEMNADTPPQAKESKPALRLLIDNQSNDNRVQILLEELRDLYNISWRTQLIDVKPHQQKQARLPLLLDDSGPSQVVILESAGILTYLQEKIDEQNIFGFTSISDNSQMMHWLHFWHSSSPVRGHARQFLKRVREPIPYAMDAFQKSMLRTYSILESHLSGQGGFSAAPREYLAGDGAGKYSIADMGAWPYVQVYRSWELSEEDMRPMFPHLLQWIDRMTARPAVQRGIDAIKYDSEENTEPLGTS